MIKKQLKFYENIHYEKSLLNQTFFEGFPGRTFLGKRRYFSGIAALTPLTPLTYKQNAVNAFIPTKKTPLTPLY